MIDHSFDLLVTQRISTGGRKGESLSESTKEAGILLFATVVELAQSPSGIKFRMLFQIPDFPRLLSILVKGLFWPLPRAALKWLVRTVTRMPEDAADVTTNLLIGKSALWQAL